MESGWIGCNSHSTPSIPATIASCTVKARIDKTQLWTTTWQGERTCTIACLKKELIEIANLLLQFDLCNQSRWGHCKPSYWRWSRCYSIWELPPHHIETCTWVAQILRKACSSTNGQCCNPSPLACDWFGARNESDSAFQSIVFSIHESDRTHVPSHQELSQQLRHYN